MKEKFNLFVLLVFCFGLLSCGVFKDNVESQIKQAFQEEMNTNLSYQKYGMKVQSVTLVSTGLNSYDGYVIVTLDTDKHKVPIVVKGNALSGYMFETKPFAFAFLMQYRW